MTQIDTEWVEPGERTRLTRREIIEKAKLLVLQEGPEHVLEFGDEAVERSLIHPADESLLLAEAAKQSRRVYEFLGYNAPW